MPKGRDAAGNVWEYDSLDAQGNPVNARLVQAAAPQMPADPAFPYQGAQAQAQAANTGAEAQVNQATIAAQIAAAEAEATIKQRQAQTAGLPEGQQWNPDGSGIATIPGYTRQGLSPEVRQNAIQAYTDADALDRAADEIEQRFREGPGATSGIRGLQDYLPTDANKVFNDAGQQARGYVKRALGFTGGEGNTVAESSALYDPYLPTAGDRDAQIEAKIRKLRELANDSRTKAVTTLGGRPDGNGNIIPLREEQPNALTQLRIGNPQGLTAAPFGSTQGGTTTIPPEMTQELDALTARLMQQNGGRLNPQAYAREGAAIAGKYGFDPGDLAGWATGVNEYLDSGGKTVPSGARIENRELSGVEQFRNNLVSNPIGAGAAGFLDAGGFGGVTALAPDQMAALGDANPIAMTIGQIGGSIGATSALARGSRFLAERGGAGVAPRLLGGGGAGQFGRNVATDAAYSGVYGANTGQDPLESAVWGAGGSVGGQAIGSAIGRGVSGVTSSPTIARLRDMGVTPTLGQIMRGRAADNGGRSIVAGLEDVVANNGAAGTFVNSARNRALEEANLAGFNIGANGRPVTDIGERGLGQLDTAVDDAYNTALGGVSLDATNPQFVSDFNAAGQAGQAVDAARGRGDFGYIMNNELAPIFNGPQVSGEQLQDALRLLRGRARTYRQAANGANPDPMAGGVANATDQATQAFVDLAGNTSPDIIPQLDDANSMYRNLMVLDDAAGRGEGGVFTAAQLKQAVKANNSMFGQRGLRARARSPFHQLQQDMETVLPNKVPPTGVNAAPMLAIGSAAMGGAGAVTDNDYLKAAGLIGLSATPYTRVGQRAVATALLDRPEAMRQLGRQIRNRTGLFGSATLPFVIAE